jgi:hypothetical protein
MGMTMHRFDLGQSVAFWAPRGLFAASGAYVVTAKLPKRDGEFGYKIRSPSEQHELMARETDLRAIDVNDNAPGAGRDRR